VDCSTPRTKSSWLLERSLLYGVAKIQATYICDHVMSTMNTFLDCSDSFDTSILSAQEGDQPILRSSMMQPLIVSVSKDLISQINLGLLEDTFTAQPLQAESAAWNIQP
jgi:hypothetical protein